MGAKDPKPMRNPGGETPLGFCFMLAWKKALPNVLVSEPVDIEFPRLIVSRRVVSSLDQGRRGRTPWFFQRVGWQID